MQKQINQLNEHDLNVSRETLQKLQSYVALIDKWNKHINLVSRKLSVKDIINHIKDAVFLGHVLKKVNKILDLGSGNGLPGIVLSIMGFKCLLVERNNKKAVFLKEAVRLLKLDAKVINADIRDCYAFLQEIDVRCIVSKAVSDAKGVIDLCRPIINEATVVYLFKKKSMLDELNDLEESCWCEPVIIENKNVSDSVLLELKKIKFKR